MSRMKPMSSIRSASSRTRISIADRSTMPWPMWSMQPAGRRHDDVGAATEGAELAVVADAAVDRDGLDGPLGAVRPDALLDLEGQLPGGDEDEHARRTGPAADRRTRRAVLRRRRRGPAVEMLEDRQHEGGRLAGAGLGAGEHVAARQHERNRLGLDGCGLGIALVRDSAEELGRQPELIKGHGMCSWRGPPAHWRGPVRAGSGSKSAVDDRGADRSAHRARRPEA